MAAPRGRQQRGKTVDRPSDAAIRAGLVLKTGDPVRTAYDWLVEHEGVSGAEVIRRALLDRYENSKKTRRSVLKEAG
ncbi:hypothetical protein [Streptomyces sp. NPDC051162]|uniref:hypothetical protein n=1 Tax=Streptomyces sp. NPDC051162 TaxID=3154747 RepID=UPI003416AC08